MIFIYLAMLIISVLFYILYKGVISFLVLVFVFAVPIVMLTMLLICRRKITAALKLENSRCTAGQSIPIAAELTNPTLIPVLNCEITLEITLASENSSEKIRINTPIFPRNMQRLSASFSSSHYGLVRCRMISVKIYDMLRLFRFKLPAKKLNHINCEAIILPKQIDLENTVSDYSDIGLESENYSAVKAGDDPSEIFSIRDYSDGDRMSRVHWKLTAKEDRLMVKDYSLPLADSFFIVADTYIPPQFAGHSAEIYDTLAVMTTSISQLLCQNNARHIVGFFDDRSQEAEFIKVDEEGESITACVRLMMAGCCNKPSRLVSEILESGDQRRRYGHMICISAIYDAAYAEALICSGLACRYTFLICGGGADGTELAGDHANAEIVRIDPKNAAASLAALTL